jgi:four helix bundle protein
VDSDFRQLAAYRLAARVSDEAYDLVAAWPSFDRWSLGMQLVRAADSIGANIAEATGRWSFADKRRLLLIARGSLLEVEHWLARAEQRGLLATPPDLTELAKTLNGLIRRPVPS